MSRQAGSKAAQAKTKAARSGESVAPARPMPRGQAPEKIPSGPEEQLRPEVAPAPRGRDRWSWYGPGLMWMVSSVGSGSILFTPRVGSRYGFAMLWMAVLVAFLTWVMIREMGRYSVVTGRTILDGYNSVPGPRGWAVWLIFLPGLVSGVAVVAGIAGLVGSTLMLALPGSQAMYAVGTILLSAALVVSGRYKKLEKLTTVMAAVLILSAFVTALMVFPGWETMASGMVPTLPPDFDAFFVLPWVGFLLAGAAGVMWFSYWVAVRGYGGELLDSDEKERTRKPGAEERGWLRSWLVTMGITAAIGVVGASLVNVSFLTLGAELLRPLGIIPEGVRVAEDLANLLTQVWGPAGLWVLVLGMFVALWGSILANQDGWSRIYADATLMTLRRGRLDEELPGWLRRLTASRLRLRNAYVFVVLTAAPIAAFFAVRDPVSILSVGGIVSAAHMPLVVGLTLWLNQRRLPREFRPGPVWFTATLGVVLFYGFFSAIYFIGLLR